MTAGSEEDDRRHQRITFAANPLQTVGVSKDLVADEDSPAGRRRVILAATLTVPPKQSPSWNTTGPLCRPTRASGRPTRGRLSTNSNPYRTP
jgi:hypothetical protein